MRFFLCLKASIVAVALSFLSGCQSSSSPSTVNVKPSADAENGMINLIAGTYNQKGSEGIYTFTYDKSSKSFTAPTLLTQADNPSFLHVTQDSLFAVKELGNGTLDQYRRTPTGVELMSSQRTQGASPCYISQSPSGEFVATANYMGGSVSIFRLSEQGIVAEPQVLQHVGKGPNKARQEAAHAHWVQWNADETRIYAVDLGIDKVKVYPFDSNQGIAGEGRVALTLSPGDGPRHMFFHPNKKFAYILTELSNTIKVSKVNEDGSLSIIQSVDMLPEAFNGHNQAGHIYVNTEGTLLYASNRGHDSIVVYAVGADGLLSLADRHPSGGQWPRHFIVLEEQGLVIVANQESNNIVALEMDDRGLIVGPVAELDVPQVTFLGLWD